MDRQQLRIWLRATPCRRGASRRWGCRQTTTRHQVLARIRKHEISPIPEATAPGERIRGAETIAARRPNGTRHCDQTDP